MGPSLPRWWLHPCSAGFVTSAPLLTSFWGRTWPCLFLCCKVYPSSKAGSRSFSDYSDWTGACSLWNTELIERGLHILFPLLPDGSTLGNSEGVLLFPLPAWPFSNSRQVNLFVQVGKCSLQKFLRIRIEFSRETELKDSAIFSEIREFQHEFLAGGWVHKLVAFITSAAVVFGHIARRQVFRERVQAVYSVVGIVLEHWVQTQIKWSYSHKMVRMARQPWKH